jgi:pimeloyl-ACP methyl ester carboxylesterase
VKNAAACRRVLYCLRHVWRENFAPWWHSIRIPTLILHGKKDTIVSWKNAEALAGLVPNARLALLETGNHILPVNNVTEVAPLIARFFEENVVP